jgi:hypothetical protein
MVKIAKINYHNIGPRLPDQTEMVTTLETSLLAAESSSSLLLELSSVLVCSNLRRKSMLSVFNRSIEQTGKDFRVRILKQNFVPEISKPEISQLFCFLF